MNKRLLLLAAAVSAPATAALFWMLTPGPVPADLEKCEAKPPLSATKVAPAQAVHASLESPSLTRKSEADFAEPTIETAAAASPAPESGAVASRFLPDGQMLTSLPRRDAVNGLGIRPTERFRVLPPATTTARIGTDESGNSAGNAAAIAAITPAPTAPLVLAVERSLHDPAAWVATNTPITEPQAAVKEKIADEFASQIAAAAQDPKTATEGIDKAWMNSKAEANASYRKMFGESAFSRALLGAGRTAVGN